MSTSSSDTSLSASKNRKGLEHAMSSISVPSSCPTLAISMCAPPSESSCARVIGTTDDDGKTRAAARQTRPTREHLRELEVDGAGRAECGVGARARHAERPLADVV